MKRIFALSFALLNCTTTSSPDGGVADATVIDGPIACQPDAGPDPHTLEDISPTHPPHQAACTAAQIADYAQCQGAKDTDLCAEFKPTGTAAACGACIETPKTAPDGGINTWGVIVFNNGVAFMNVEGCVNDVLGTTECGNNLYKLYQCQELTCSGCTGNDFNTCVLETTIDPAYCRDLANAVADGSGACAPLNGDVIPVDAQNCFPDTSISDTTKQQVDWLTRIVGYMCGP